MSTLQRISQTDVVRSLPERPTALMQMLIKHDPSRFSATPEPLRHLCPYCKKPQEPRFQYGGYVYRECHCELLVRMDAQHQAEVQTLHQEQAANYRKAAYSWLEKYTDPSVTAQRRLERQQAWSCLEQHSFANYDRSRFPFAFESAKALAGHITGEGPWLRNLIFVGNPGVGKTHLAAAIANAVTEVGIRARFCTAAGLFAVLFAVELPSQQEIQYALGTCPLAVIDDLSQLHIKKDGGDYQRKWLLEMLDIRNTRHLPTVITANEMTDLSPWLSPPAISRMSEQGKFEKMQGADYRLIKATI